MTAAIQSTATNDGSGTTATGNKPGGVTSGDLMVAAVAYDLSATPAPTITPPAGWDTVQDALFDVEFGVRLGVYSRIAGGSEPASWDWTLSNSDNWIVIIARITGHDSSDPVDVSGKTDPVVSTDTPTAPAVTTTVDDCLVLYIVGMDGDETPFSPPAGTNEEWDYGDGSDVCQSAASKTQASAGNTGTGQFTASGSNQWAAVTLAVAPAGATTSTSTTTTVSTSTSTSISSTSSSTTISSTSVSTTTTVSSSTSTSISSTSSSVTVSTTTSSSTSTSITTTSVSTTTTVSSSTSTTQTVSTSISTTTSTTTSITVSTSTTTTLAPVVLDASDLTEPRSLMYIEQVKFSEPYGLQLIGGDDQRLETMLANRGFRAEDDNGNDGEYHPKDKPIVTPYPPIIVPGNGNGGGGGGGVDPGYSNGPYDVLYPCGQVPLFGIIMWSGAVADIPECYILCDGTPPTPDLRDRFIVGAGGSYSPGDTGGADTVDLSHTHADTFSVDSDSHSHADTFSVDSDSHDHNDTFSVDNDAHTHDVTGSSGTEPAHAHGSGGIVTTITGAAPGYQVDAGSTATVVTKSWFDAHIHNTVNNTTSENSHSHTDGTYQAASDSHNHNLSGSVSSDSHSHNLSGSVSSDSHSHNLSGSVSTGGTAAHDNRPQYYALCFIMRVE